MKFTSGFVLIIPTLCSTGGMTEAYSVVQGRGHLLRVEGYCSPPHTESNLLECCEVAYGSQRAILVREFCDLCHLSIATIVKVPPCIPFNVINLLV